MQQKLDHMAQCKVLMREESRHLAREPSNGSLIRTQGRAIRCRDQKTIQLPAELVLLSVPPQAIVLFIFLISVTKQLKRSN